MIEPSPELIEGIVQKIKTNGMFDEMRRDCLADIDTKPAFQNLKQRVETFVNTLLSNEVWTPSLNKNQLRSKVRTSVVQSGMLNTGIEHILHQVVDAKMYTQFLPKISDFIAENREELKKEFLPELEKNEAPETDGEDVAGKKDEADEEDEAEVEFPTNQEEKLLEFQQQNDQVEVTKDESEIGAKSNLNVDEKESVQAPVIPEGAANTLRNLIQSLMGSGIQNLIPTDTTHETQEEYSQNMHTGNSPSIDPAHIEAFTDESETSDNDPLISKGPKTPPSEKSAPVSGGSNTDTKHSQLNESGSEENVESDPGNIAMHSDQHSEKSYNESVKYEYSSPDGGQSVDEYHEVVEEQTKVDDVYEENIVEIQGENVLVEEYVVEENPQDEEYEEVVMVEEIESQHLIKEEYPTEHKKRHKRHHRRRRHSSTEDSSNDSGQLLSSLESDKDVGSEEENQRIKSRKKRRKKRSKKHKRQKVKHRDQSPHDSVSRDELPGSSSEYLRSSLSPQRRPFMTSPDERSLRLEELRGVKVEPIFLPQMTSRFREPYALGHRDAPHPDIDRGPPRPSDVFRPRYSPPHPYMHPRFPPHSRFSPPFPSRPPFHGQSPPPRRYSPTYDFYRPPLRPGFEPPPRSPPPNRRFSPPRQVGRYPFGPHDDRGPLHGSRGHRPFTSWGPLP